MKSPIFAAAVVRGPTYGLAALVLWFGFALPALAGDPAELRFGHQDAEAWLNSEPISAEALHGRVVLLDLFTAG